MSIQKLFEPYHDNVLVEVFEAVGKTAAGIIIPDQSKDKPHKGVVVAVGKGRFDDKGNLHLTQVKPGHTILFQPYAGTKIEVAGKEYLLLREQDIIGRFLDN